MAVDSVILYNDCYCYLRDSMGQAYGGASAEQIHNAEKIYNLLRVLGYSASAACGILGNMQTESGLSPAALSGNLAALPNNGEHFSDLTNTVVLDWNSNNSTGAHATGLIQWDGTSNQTPVGNQIVSFATRYDYIWYDWEMQIFRREMEYIYDPSGWGGVNGTTYNFWYYMSGGTMQRTMDWSAFKSYTGTPEDAADAFRINRERSSGDATGNQHRRDNARYWYNRLSSATVTTEVTGKLNAAMAYLFRDSQYTYSQYDCIHFVNLVRARLGLPQMTNGTNSLWRNVGGNFLYWRGTLDECISLYGGVPVGAYLFKCYPEGSAGYDTIPDQYRGDGIGNFDHIGIYTDLGLGVMQSAGYDVTPPSGFNGVHDTRTRLDETPPWWTHVAFGNNIIISGAVPISISIPVFVSILNKKKVKKNVIRIL